MIPKGAFLPMLSGLPLRVPDLVQAEMTLHSSFISELSFESTFLFIFLFEAQTRDKERFGDIKILNLPFSYAAKIAAD